MKIIVVTPFDGTEWEWFGKDFGGDRYSWDFHNLALFGQKPWVWLWRSLNVVSKIRDGDVLITHHPYMTFYVALALKVFGVKKKHHAFSFNHGNGRFFRGLMRTMATRLFADVDAFVVYSEYEKKIYSEYYNVPIEKFSFVHWAVQSPDVSGIKPDYIDAKKPYICCMGRNNRDFDLFVDVVSGLNLPAIIVSKKGQIKASELPENILLKNDIPMKEAMQILAGSEISVIPLKDASTGAGHITIVSAMQLGVPQIITRLPTVSDYFIDGDHGMFVDPHSKESLKKAIEFLWNHSDERLRISENVRGFADRWFTEESSKLHLTEYIHSLITENSPPSCPPGWTR